MVKLSQELRVIKEKGDSILNASSGNLESLEEELVVLKEQYVAVIEEKMVLDRELIKAQEQYSAIRNRSNNTMFIYIAPLVIYLLYVLIIQIFSWLTAVYFLFFYLCYKFFIRIINATT